LPKNGGRSKPVLALIATAFLVAAGVITYLWQTKQITDTTVFISLAIATLLATVAALVAA
jgi:hypothetical protein